MLAMLPRAFWGYLLSVVFVLAVVGVTGFAAWHYISGFGYKIQIADLKNQLAKAETDAQLCAASKAVLEGHIETRKRAYAALLDQAELRAEAAAVLEQRAEAELAESRRRYERMRENWPADAVEAIELVRARRGI